MNDLQLTVLEENDFARFNKQYPVVRLFKTYWYVGVFQYAVIVGNACRLRIVPHVRIQRNDLNNLGDPADCLVRTFEKAKPGTLMNSSQPFFLQDPFKVDSTQPKEVMVIQSKDPSDWTAIISLRDQDVKAIYQLTDFVKPEK